MGSVRLNPRALRAELNRFANRDAKRVAEQIAAQAARTVNVRSGDTRDSIAVVKSFSWRGPQWRVVVNDPVGQFLELGTRPHKIRARNAKVLRFEVGGRVVYARVVNHPGTKATHFLAKATRQVAIANGYNVRITE